MSELNDIFGTKHGSELLKVLLDFFDENRVAIEMYQDWMANRSDKEEFQSAVKGVNTHG